MFEYVIYGMANTLWKKMVKKNNIDPNSVVLVLADENEKLDEIAIKRLPDYKNKRYASSAFVIVPSDYKTEITTCENIIYLPKKKIKNLYQLHCFYNFFNNIVFTYISVPKDNNLGRYLNESKITEEDIVCLALYRLGKV